LFLIRIKSTGEIVHPDNTPEFGDLVASAHGTVYTLSIDVDGDYHVQDVTDEYEVISTSESDVHKAKGEKTK
jgi:hypothetical protein